MFLDQNGDHDMNFDDSLVPDLGTEAILRMSDEEFLTMFPPTNNNIGDGGASTISFGDALRAPAPPSFLNMHEVPRQHPVMAQVPNQPPGEPPTRSNIPSLYVHTRPGLTFPAACGSQPFTQLERMEGLAKDMALTMERLRNQCTVSLDLLRHQHNASYEFYMKLRKEQPGDVVDVTWNRYVDEIGLTYNMLRDYQMHAYKSMCGALKIWIRYHQNFFSQATIDLWNTEMAAYIDIQRNVLAYRLPDWPNQQGLQPFKDDVDVDDPFKDNPKDTPTSNA